MTYLHPHLHLTWGGRLFTDETWSCGLRLHDDWINLANVSSVQDECALKIADYASILNAMHVDANLPINGAAWLDWVKLNWVGTNGKQDPMFPTVLHTFDVPNHGVGQVAPGQLALVISLRTAIPRGRAHSGRIYLPMGQIGSLSGTTGQNAPEAVNLWATAVATRLFAINHVSWVESVEGFGPSVTVMSNIGTGTNQNVTEIRVGRVYDTQRRRRRSLSESYITRAITAL